MSKLPSIIQAYELKENLNDPHLVILDARAGMGSRDLYLKSHVKGARYIDLDIDLAAPVTNASRGGRHPLPDFFDFAKTLSVLGIKEDSRVVIYDDKGGANAAARCWWMLKSFGLEQVQVVSGGYQAWGDFEMKSGEEHIHQSIIKIPDHWTLPTVEINDVELLLNENKAVVIDVRDAYRYLGESEPIDPVAGHIPGAINIPLTENLDASGLFLSAEDLKEKYKSVFEDASKQVIVQCGSGVTACHTLLALDYAGFKMPSLFVGSWSEWCRSGKTIAVGEN